SSDSACLFPPSRRLTPRLSLRFFDLVLSFECRTENQFHLKGENLTWQTERRCRALSEEYIRVAFLSKQPLLYPSRRPFVGNHVPLDLSRRWFETDHRKRQLPIGADSLMFFRASICWPFFSGRHHGNNQELIEI